MATRRPLCVVCMDRQRDSLLSCGHSNICGRCLEQLPTQHCPTCRRRITSISLTPHHSSYQRNIHLLATQTPTTTPTTTQPLTPRQKSILFIAPPSVPLQPLFQALQQSHPPKLPRHSQRRDNSVEISFNERQVRLIPYLDNNNGGVSLSEVIRRTRPKLVIMCCSKSSIGTFEKMVRSDLELLQANNNNNTGARSPQRIWVIIDNQKCQKNKLSRRMSHCVENGDVKAAWHYLGTPRLMVNVDLGGGKNALRKLVMMMGFYVGVRLPAHNSGRLTFQEGQAAQFKDLFRSLLCLKD